jgi:hypothetical protein
MTDTNKFGLERPEEGTVNWDEPLNRNFTKIDDSLLLTVANEDELSSISSGAGQPAFALDTRSFFIGQTDGTWAYQGEIVPERDSGTGDGAVVPGPEDVQAAIDDVAASGGGLVRLNPTQRYEQDSTFPWVVKRDVTLDFNGAKLYGSGNHPNTDMIHVYPQAQIINPRIDLWDEFNGYAGGNPFQANVFLFDAGFDGPYFADGTTIRGGYTRAVGDGGTWCKIQATNGTQTENTVTCISIDSDFGTPKKPNNTSPPSLQNGVYIDSGEADLGGSYSSNGYINSLFFRGNWRDAKVTIKQSGSNPNNNHYFEGTIQPPGIDGNHVWEITPGTFSRHNVFKGVVWDVNTGNFPGRDAWLIDSAFDYGGSRQTKENSIVGQFDRMAELTMNNSGFNHYFRNHNTFTTVTV